VVIAQTPFASIEDRKLMAATLFETLAVPRLLVKPQSCFAIFASGSNCGLSVDFGEDSVNIVPVYECESLSSSPPKHIGHM